MSQLLKKGVSIFLQIKVIPTYLWALLSTFLIGVCFSLTITFTPLFGIQQIGMNTFSLGIFLTVTAFFEVLFSSIIAKLSDEKFERKNLLFFACLVSFIGYLLFSFVTDYYILLIISAFCVGISAAVFPQIFAYVKEIADTTDVDSTIAISVQRTVFSFSWVIGPILSSILIWGQNYSFLFLFVGLIYFTVAIIVYVKLRTTNKLVEIKQNSNENLSYSKKSLRIILLVSICAFVLFEISNSMSGIITPLLIISELGGSNSTVGLMVSINSLLQMPLMIFFSLLAKKYGNFNLMKVAGVLGTIYFIIISFSTSIWHIISSQIFSASFIAIVLGLGISYCQDLIPDSPGKATTFYSNSVNIGAMMGGFFAGMIGEWLNFRTVLLVCALLTAIGFIIIYSSSVIKSKQQITSLKGKIGSSSY